MKKVHFNTPEHILRTEFIYNNFCGYIYDEKNCLRIVWAKYPKYENIIDFETIVKKEYQKLKLF